MSDVFEVEDLGVIAAHSWLRIRGKINGLRIEEGEDDFYDFGLLYFKWGYESDLSDAEYSNAEAVVDPEGEEKEPRALGVEEGNEVHYKIVGEGIKLRDRQAMDSIFADRFKTDAMWNNSVASEKFWLNGLSPKSMEQKEIEEFPYLSESLMFNTTNELGLEIENHKAELRATEDTPFDRQGKALEIKGTPASNGSRCIYWVYKVDLTGFDKLKIWNKCYSGKGNGGTIGLFELPMDLHEDEHLKLDKYIPLDDEASRDHWIMLEYDISEHSGDHYLALGSKNNNSEDDWEQGDLFFGIHFE